MARKNKVSGKTHSQKQLNDYANQNNPNNKAYKCNQNNIAYTKSLSKKAKSYDVGILEGESYGWCDD